MPAPRLANAKRLLKFRHRLEDWRLYPLTRLARTFWWTVAATWIFWLLTLVLPQHSSIRGLFSALHALAYSYAWFSGLVLTFRWVRRTILWRVRNRLIVTYLFIGGVPILLLLALAAGSTYLMSGQFATYLASSDLKNELERITVRNRAISAHIEGEARTGKIDLAHIPELKPELKSDARFSQSQIELFDENLLPASSSGPADAVRFTRPLWLQGDLSAIVRDGGKLFFRAARSFQVGDRSYTLITSEPVTSALMERAIENLGVVEINPSGVIPTTGGGTFFDANEQQLNKNGGKLTQEEIAARENEQAKQGEAEIIRSGVVPARLNRFDTTFRFLTPMAIKQWSDGSDVSGALIVTTRPSILYNRLFISSAQWGSVARYTIFGTAVFFGFLEILALFIGMRLTRRITHAVAELYSATRHIELGDLNHRIKVREKDQLAALESSFNSMSASIGRLLLEQREKERLQSELAIAQEVQEQLYPRSLTPSPDLELFGACLPARSVSGDYYDFLTLGDGQTGIAMGDVSGKGISAALLMATIQSAVRAYEFGREIESPALAQKALAGKALVAHASNGGSQALTLSGAAQSPAKAMWLLNRHLYASTPPEKYATLFLGVYDAHSRKLCYANGGHLPPIVVRSNGQVERLTVSGTVIGLFDDGRWPDAEVQLVPGDLFVAYSDGVTEPENEFGEFGDDRLISLLQQHRNAPVAQISKQVLDSVAEWIGASEQPDDVTIVLARVR